MKVLERHMVLASEVFLTLCFRRLLRCQRYLRKCLSMLDRLRYKKQRRTEQEKHLCLQSFLHMILPHKKISGSTQIKFQSPCILMQLSKDGLLPRPLKEARSIDFHAFGAQSAFSISMTCAANGCGDSLKQSYLKSPLPSCPNWSLKGDKFVSFSKNPKQLENFRLEVVMPFF